MKNKILDLLIKKNNPQEGAHHLFLIWLILTGLVVFTVIITWREGLLVLLYSTDQSRICYAITIMYFIVTVHCARRFFHISSQIDISRNVEKMIRTNANLKLTLDGNKVHINGDGTLPECEVTNYIHDLLHKVKNSTKAMNDPGDTETELIQVYESRLKGPHEMGWFASDLMIKLGLLGTIIGFVLMMGSVANIKELDINAIQEVLQKMSVGMGTALYTTLAGLVFNMLTTAQYYTLDRKIDQLIETTRHLTEVYIIPKIK